MNYAGDSECYSLWKSISDHGKEKQAKAIACDINREWIALPADQPTRDDSNDYMCDFGADAYDPFADAGGQQRRGRF